MRLTRRRHLWFARQSLRSKCELMEEHLMQRKIANNHETRMMCVYNTCWIVHSMFPQSFHFTHIICTWCTISFNTSLVKCSTCCVHSPFLKWIQPRPNISDGFPTPHPKQVKLETVSPSITCHSGTVHYIHVHTQNNPVLKKKNSYNVIQCLLAHLKTLLKNTHFPTNNIECGSI